MRILTFIIALVSLNVYAAEYERKEANFTIRDRVGFDIVYYNCDSAEYTVESILEEMGAKDIRVRCTGGLDPIGSIHLPARINAEFEAINAELDGKISVKIDEVKFRNHKNCHLYNSVVKAVQDQFEIAHMEMRRCHRIDGSTLIKMSVLKEVN
ncbi:MAG: hypothetical protein VX642_15725 [Bdellovibrionota bacterium]|nr:hypothetical protein [Bdellovibrionota bacterium]